MVKLQSQKVTLSLVHEQVIDYLKERLSNIDCIVESSYFFQEALKDRLYRATIILNSSECYFVAIHIGDIDDFYGTLDFTLLKQVE